MFIFEFLLGIFLGYYVMSSRLRHVVNSIIMALLRLCIPKLRKSRLEAEDIQEEPVKHTKPVSKSRLDNGKVITELSEVEKWFNDNPDLRRVNGG